MEQRVRASWWVAGILVLVLAACGGVGPSGGGLAFSNLRYTSGAGGATQFHWLVTGAGADPLTCTLDGDGNGTVDVTIQDCGNVTSAGYSYAAPGAYTATLTVDDGQRTATAKVRVIANGTGATPLSWVRQFGSSAFDVARSVAVDGAGNALVAGHADGALAGTSFGGRDAFLAKYDGNGSLLWLRQFGTTFSDAAFGVAVDADGNAVVAGETDAPLPPPLAATGLDILLAKYDADGDQLWTRQGGTVGNESVDGVALDAGADVFVAGDTEGAFLGFTNAGAQDVFLTKYDPDGHLVWAQQFGTSGSDFGRAVAADDAGNAFVAGSMDDKAFVAKYGPDGQRAWLRSFGASFLDEVWGAAVDGSGDVVVTGPTIGSLSGPNAGGFDAFVARYDTDGNRLWIRQLGTSGDEFPFGVAVDAAHNVLVVGVTSGALSGTNAGDSDVFVAKYDATGNLVWLRQFGTGMTDYGNAVAVDLDGNLLLAGSTFDAVQGANAGDSDAYVAKYLP